MVASDSEGGGGREGGFCFCCCCYWWQYEKHLPKIVATTRERLNVSLYSLLSLSSGLLSRLFIYSEYTFTSTLESSVRITKSVVVVQNYYQGAKPSSS